MKVNVQWKGEEGRLNRGRGICGGAGRRGMDVVRCKREHRFIENDVAG